MKRSEALELANEALEYLERYLERHSEGPHAYILVAMNIISDMIVEEANKEKENDN